MCQFISFCLLLFCLVIQIYHLVLKVTLNTNWHFLLCGAWNFIHAPWFDCTTVRLRDDYNTLNIQLLKDWRSLYHLKSLLHENAVWLGWIENANIIMQHRVSCKPIHWNDPESYVDYTLMCYYCSDFLRVSHWFEWKVLQVQSEP